MTTRNTDSETKKRFGTPMAQLLFNGVYSTIADSVARQAGALEGRVHFQDLLPGGNVPGEGTIPEEYLPDVGSYDWLKTSDWMGASDEAFPTIDWGSVPEPGSGAGVEGEGLDWFRTGEAEANYANRFNPLYQARADFAAAVAAQIEKQFNVNASGEHYLRPPSASDAAPGGRSSNSDHYSAGAIDFYGSPERLTALRNWLITQPYISFVRYESPDHLDHLHASFDIGWVAKNYFDSKVVPTVKPPNPLTPPLEAARASSVVTAEQRSATPVVTQPPPTVQPGRPS